jgi:type II secretory pathway component GspD/PulD (secretin)
MHNRKISILLLILAVSVGCLLSNIPIIFCADSTTSTPVPSSATSAPEWTPGTQYNAGNVISYKGNTYTCRQPHTALVNGDPSTVPTLWQLVKQQSQSNGTPTSPGVSAATVPPTAPPGPSAMTNGAAPASGSSSLVIHLNYLKPDQVKSLIGTLMPDNRVRVEIINNKLAMFGGDEECKQIKAIVDKLDVPSPQVMFEAQAVEISRNDVKNLGIDWGVVTALPTAAATDGNSFRISFGNSGYGLNLQATINHLIENKKGRLLASPRLAALDGQTATILIGDKLAVESTQIVSGSTMTSVNYVDVGIKLEVTPTIHDDGTITTHIKPEVSNKTDTSKSGNPNIRTRQVDTTLRVKSGETIVLGGLMQTQETIDAFKTPILGDIPLIGHLFRSKSTEKSSTELIILITPKIINP